MFKNRKLMRITMLILGILLLATSTVFVARRALAGSCFTDIANGSFWYDVTCWMKTKGISTGYADGTYKPDNNVTRGEMSLFIQRAFSNTSQVEFFTTGPSAWVTNDASPSAYVQTYYGWTHLHSTAYNTVMFQISPTIPTSLYNTAMYAKGVKLCYLIEAGAYITQISIKHMWYTTSGLTEWNSAVDPTDRTSTGCTTLYFASPAAMWGTDQVTVLLEATYGNVNVPIYIGTTTVIVYPSTAYAYLGELGEMDPLMFRGEVAPAEYDPALGLP